MSGLVLHCGSHAATLEEIGRVPTPPPTVTHYPIAHAALVREVRGQLLDARVQITEEAYGLSHDGARLFGVLALHAEALPTVSGADLVLGVRNSHDKTFCAGLALGTRVFVCDNLAFVGTRTLARKHTRFVERDLPALIARILGKLTDWAERQAEMIQTYEATELSHEQAHDFMVKAIRSKVIAPSRVTRVIDAWHGNGHDRTLWVLFNAVTEALRGTIEVPELARRTERLFGLADLHVAHVRGGNGNGHGSQQNIVDIVPADHAQAASG